MKKLFLLLPILTLLLFPGCVSQSKYDALKQENEDLKNQVADLREQLQKAGEKPASSTRAAKANKSTASFIGGETLYRNFKSYRGKTVTVKGHAVAQRDAIFVMLYEDNERSGSQSALIEPANLFDYGIEHDILLIKGVVANEFNISNKIVIKPISIKRVEE